MIEPITSIKRSYLLALGGWLCYSLILSAQNVVLNPSFEDLVQCPEDYGTFQADVLYWTCPTDGSTDYFNSCSKQMALYRNFAGKQKAYDGNAYAGFYAFGPKDYREYIAGELKIKLLKGKKYIISARVSLSETSAYAVKDLGFLFGDKALSLETTRNMPRRMGVEVGFSNYLGISHPKFLASKSDWMLIEGEYLASGNERYLTFGNFNENRKTKILSTGENLKKAAYYYVDMVSVEEADPSFILDEIYVFEGLNFDVDGFKIEGKVKAQLQPLIAYLKENSELNIAIYGHTDNVGSKAYNKSLSEKRAKTLGLFLVDNGLAPFRIAWKGYGDASPVVANESQKGREQNRRVEFIISKKKREFYASGLFEDEDDN